jgi:hypothetical protein
MIEIRKRKAHGEMIKKCIYLKVNVHENVFVKVIFAENRITLNVLITK